ncbi:Uncharacterised protein [Achromobacter xylosoxidans]|uniref:hypothetical protein n=1 Tax=Alcaligenes xylosoxydans xylosoxydans TaxID=85698 RepID=UPI0006C0D2BF|nr:hypothetical protein [Achromobacter xylosoxidans]CUJ58824.1 Uncharacterised protein [Achromobacter xylosoxidans]
MSTNTPESPITVTVDHDPRGVSVGVWQGSHCIYSGAHPLPATPGVSTMEKQRPSRDWELTCHECDGSGHVYVKHQVAERKTDVQEFKEECECCEGRGFVFAFEDIPGIEEYVKSYRPAPASVSTVVAQPAAWMEPGIDVPVTNEYRNKTPLRQAKYSVPLYRHAPVAAPAAGDARDAERYRWLRDPQNDPALVLDKRTGYVPADESIPGVGGYHTYEYRAGEELDAAIDAAIAAQRQGDA